MKAYSIPIQTRFRDIDMNHHVNNAVYFTYMENARSVLLVDALLKYHSEGMQFIVAEARCKYIRPIKLNDKLVCDMSFALVRPTAFDILYLFKNEESGLIYAEGSTRMVLYNENTGRPLALPDWFTKKHLE